MHTSLLASSHPSGLQLAASFSTPYTTEPSLREGSKAKSITTLLPKKSTLHLNRDQKNVLRFPPSAAHATSLNKHLCLAISMISLIPITEGLVFGNSVYWIRFDEEFSEKKFKSSSPFGIKYKFHLEDAVDCPEWVVPFHVFKALAEEYDLELVFAKNSHEFVHEYLKRPEYVDLMRRLGALGDGNQDKSTLSQDEWEVAYLYLAFVLKKRGQPDRTQANNRKDGADEYIKGGHHVH
uniref:mRNA (guanine-N(7))-methyltransferase n=1 Tax=Fagus sylvatica TaxID=28930 RepID=A0A2N9GS58_FAGSY